MRFNPAKFLRKVAKTAGKLADQVESVTGKGPFPERWCPVDNKPMTKLIGYNDLWMCPDGHRFGNDVPAPPLPPKPKYEGEI
jgi:hypothetical protein